MRHGTVTPAAVDRSTLVAPIHSRQVTRPPIPLYLDDVVTLRKAHPCGGATWQLVRLGADIGMKCLSCGHRVLIPRAKLEGRIRRFEKRGPMAPVP